MDIPPQDVNRIHAFLFMCEKIHTLEFTLFMPFCVKYMCWEYLCVCYCCSIPLLFFSFSFPAFLLSVSYTDASMWFGICSVNVELNTVSYWNWHHLCSDHWQFHATFANTNYEGILFFQFALILLTLYSLSLSLLWVKLICFEKYRSLTYLWIFSRPISSRSIQY